MRGNGDRRNAPVSPRLKKLIGIAVIVPGLIIYVGAAVTLAEAVPEFWLAKLAYFIAAGLFWAVPAVPFIRWMEAEPKPRAKDAAR
jgi:uncharacterized membrane protein